MNDFPKLIVICGPTASGKSELAIKLAQKFNGEIISADARQIYQKMDIGTAKVMLDEQGYYQQIKHHLINILEPIKLFSVSEYKKLALIKINQILESGKTPFLVGGTGLYIKSITDNLEIPAVKPNEALRKKLEQKTTEDLFKMIEYIDPETAEFIDRKNKRRLIRALEVFLISGRKFSSLRNQGPPLFNSLLIAIDIKKEKLIKNISQRVELMIKQGLESEVRYLVDKYGWNLVLTQTIGYQEWKDYFENKITYDEVIKQITKNSLSYAKRQLTYFKAMKDIKWIKKEQEAYQLIKDFLK